MLVSVMDDLRLLLPPPFDDSEYVQTMNMACLQLVLKRNVQNGLKEKKIKTDEWYYFGKMIFNEQIVI